MTSFLPLVCCLEFDHGGKTSIVRSRQSLMAIANVQQDLITAYSTLQATVCRGNLTVNYSLSPKVDVGTVYLSS